MRKGLFWLNDKQWAQIEPHLPTNQTGPAREDDRRIISGIIHMLQCGARWRDCPSDYGPYTTIYNRFNRWAKRGLTCPCRFPPVEVRVRPSEGRTDEASQVYGRADYWRAA
ncbi:hypothetical protein ACVWZ6_002956 [Bradyrhizobium sp. GM6.1]